MYSPDGKLHILLWVFSHVKVLSGALVSASIYQHAPKFHRSHGVMSDYDSQFLNCADHYSAFSLPRYGHGLSQAKYTKQVKLFISLFEVNVSLPLLIVGYS